MTGKEIFKIWAPSKTRWVDWVRPVPFIAIDKNYELHEFIDFNIPSVHYIDQYEKDTAIFIDLPEYESIEEGIALTKLGYRPIPLFNGTIEDPNIMSTTNNHIIIPALIIGANYLEQTKLDKDTNPSFLLDTERLNRHKMNENVFDNSWDIYDQDVPTAEYFIKHDINKIIVHSDKIQKDLKKILYKYQQKGLKIYHTKGYEKPTLIKVRKPTKRELKSI